MVSSLDVSRANRWAPPPAPRSNVEFAPTMLLPDGSAAGEKWDPSTEPVQAAWVREQDNPHWQVFVGVASSQRGKTLMGVALPLLRAAVELRQNVSYVMPNLEKLTQAWEAKLRPLLIGCGYGAWLPEKGPGSRGGKPAVLTLRDPTTGARAGSIFFLAAGGGGKESSLASVTTPVVIVDEADDLESEAHLGLAFRRVRSFGEDYRVCVVSTLNERKNRDSHPLLTIYDRGSRSQLWYACPHCGRYQPLVWEQVRIDDLDAGYLCPHCSAMWTDADRHKALDTARLVHGGQVINESGAIVGDRPPGRTFSLLAWDLEFHRASLAQVASEYRAAQQSISDRSDHSAMRQFYYKVLCRDYTGDIDEMEQQGEITWQELFRRSERCAWGPVLHSTDKNGPGVAGHLYSRHVTDLPEAADFCVGGVDVQGNRIYTLLVGSAPDGTSYDACWSYEMARPDHAPWNRGELFALLDRANALFRSWAGECPLAAIGLDIGDFSEDLLAWIKPHRTLWKPTRGRTTHLKDEPGDIEGLVYPRDGVYLLQIDNLRELIHAAYRRPNGAPGAAHIPRGLSTSGSDLAFPKHLAAERMVLDKKAGKLKLKQGPGRWDWQDCRRICEALIRVQRRRLSRPKRNVPYGVVSEATAIEGVEWQT